ncbi:MAG: glycosyltransferase [Gammaproteobacteria bacterium]|nr:glycosyltransferase [Gammaproteobacteria bacterium]
MDVPPTCLRLSVVIPAYNEAKLIAGTIATVRESLGGAGLEEGAYEIIVCDNASTDDTAALAARAGAAVVFEPERQIARARNAGASRARAPALLFLDADSWPDAALMGELLAALADDRVVAGGCTMRMHDVPPTIRVALRAWNLTSRLCRWAAGAFIFCRRDAFQAIGGFGLDFYVAEEIDFSRRIKRWGAARGLRFRVLHRHPLLTSGRKGALYSQREIGSLMLSMLRHPRRFFRDRHLLTLWYDGRR